MRQGKSGRRISMPRKSTRVLYLTAHFIFCTAQLIFAQVRGSNFLYSWCT